MVILENERGNKVSDCVTEIVAGTNYNTILYLLARGKLFQVRVQVDTVQHVLLIIVVA
jgi:hypothetical protein